MGPESVAAAILALPAAGVAVNATPVNAVSLVVRETAGIRRGNYPASATVQLAQGRLRDAAHVRLLLEKQEVPVQALAAVHWPDGSIRQLELHFNASIGVLAELRFQFEYGDDVRARPIANERLEVVESADALQVGKVRFARQPAALLQSVAFGREIVGDGLNAMSVTDARGEVYLLGGEVAVEVVERGPLAARIRYTGTLRLAADYAVPFTVTLDVPNTKSWVKYSARVEDPGHRIREIALHTSFRLGGFPWTWDFGTGSWSYGAFRNTTDSAVLTQTVGASGAADWRISSGPQGHEQLNERAAGRRPARAEGWGHLQGADRAVAFAFSDFAAAAGEYAIEADGNGQLAFRFAPARHGAAHSLTVYQHYVATPTPIGAATSPVAMSSPLHVTIER